MKIHLAHALALFPFLPCLGVLAAQSPAPQLLKDIHAQTQVSKDAFPSGLTTVAGRSYFAADDGQSGSELWMTDGTTAGTVLVKDIWPGSAGNRPNASSPARFFGYGDVVLFTATDGGNGTELWKTDGTANGTVMVKDINTGFSSSLPYEFTLFKGAVWFRATDGTNGAELWKTDGTANGTVLVKDLNTGFSSSLPSQFLVAGDRMFFKALNGSGAELWVTDGTANGTVMVKDIAKGIFSSNPHWLVRFKDKVYFSATDAVSGYELWVSDGTANGTVMVKDINPGAGSGSPAELTVVGNTIYFRANDGQNGTELWKSDGTANGTVLVKDIWPGTSYGFPTYLQPVTGGQRVIFSARNGFASTGSGIELWVSDGTANGTVMVKDINPGAASSAPVFLISTGDRWVYFRAEDGSNGSELWRTNGTANGTTMVADLNKGKLGSYPTWFAMNKGRLLFAADDGVSGYEVWTLQLAASNQHVGSGCAVKGDHPTLAGTDPVMGQNVALRLSRAPAKTLGVMLVGLPVQRPLNLGGGCGLYVNTNLAPVVLMFPVDRNGRFQFSQPVPNTTALKGVTAAVQAGVGPTATGPFGLDLTNGLHLSVGN